LLTGKETKNHQRRATERRIDIYIEEIPCERMYQQEWHPILHCQNFSEQ